MVEKTFCGCQRLTYAGLDLHFQYVIKLDNLSC